MKPRLTPADQFALAVERRIGLSLGAMLAMGLLLRVALVLAAENRLDSDEATVGVMALDILEGRALPFFFYHQAYNGGAALEAYLGAGLFAIVGPSAVALKLGICALWLASALLFADLCRRALSVRESWLALLFFCVGTPFLLEWSVKARGGYAETLLFSVLLLWVACPGTRLTSRPSLQAVSLGVMAGIGLWASEMLLPMIPCAALWLLLERAREQRARAAGGIAIGLGVGLLPLLIYNLRHDWAHLSQSALASLAGGTGSGPLSFSQLTSSGAFVLAPATLVLGVVLAIGAWRVARARPFGLPHVLLLQATLFCVAYWLGGTRFIPGVAPSRLLYAIYPALAVLVACAATWRTGQPSAHLLAAGGLAVWLVASLGATAGWATSGVPREAGSWRGSWSLTDGEGLYRALTSRGVDTAIVSYWTRWPLEFAERVERRRNPRAPALQVSMSPRTAEPSADAAFALLEDTPLLAEVERALLARNIPFYRIDWKDQAILTGLDVAAVRDLGLPPVLDRGAWPPLPAQPDGFN